MSSALSVLFVRLSAIGDVVMTTPAARALKRHMPDVRITWVVEPLSAPILEGNPDVDEVIVWKGRSLPSLLRLSRELRKKKFDAALDFQGLLRSALVTRASGAKRRIGFANGREQSPFAYNELITCPPSDDGGRCYHPTRCYLAFLLRLGVVCDDADSEPRIVITPDEALHANTILEQAGIASDEPIVVLCPATTRPNKHWTEAGWSALADKLWAENGLRAVIVGSPADQPLAERILSESKSPVLNIAGRTTLKQAAAVIDRSALVVSVDTGLLHIGAALGRPTVGIFGPTMAWRNHIERPHFVLVKKEMDCAPCRKKPTCRNFECMTDISPEEVLSSAQALLKSVKCQVSSAK